MLGFLLVLLDGKLLATSLTIGIGGSGGVFAPSLFIGGMLGTAFGVVAQAAFPGLDLSPGAFGLVGMAAVFAGASHAPIAALLIVFELTGEYAIILPLMAAVALSTGLSHLLSRDNIYTLKLLRRGIDVDARTDATLDRLRVCDAMQPAPEPIGAGAELDEPARAVALRCRTGDRRRAYLGAVLAQELEPGENGDVDAPRLARDLARKLPELRPDLSLHHALAALADHEASGLPVVSEPGGAPVGWLDPRDVLAAYGARRGPSDAAMSRCRFDPPTTRRP
ncbi:chloride channel protein [Pseudonocardia adelaidensis]|uniref:CBS domain-containing protein n=1 Tax=Pseudonocardia adelaidensis TaxID=648754 RepID=A0ABP9NL86_9PSEU